MKNSEKARYIAKLLTIIKHSSSLALLPPYTTNHLLEIANNWLEIFIKKDIILENLDIIYEFALEIHDNSFAINCYDILNANKILNSRINNFAAGETRAQRDENIKIKKIIRETLLRKANK